MRIFLPAVLYPLLDVPVLLRSWLLLVMVCCPFDAIAQKPKASDHQESAPSALTENRVNINAASRAVLSQNLKGIGPAKAEAIVSYREKHGAFKTVDELVNVKGIGPKTLEKLRASLIAGEFKMPEEGESLVEKEAAARAALQAIVKRSQELSEAAKVQR